MNVEIMVAQYKLDVNTTAHLMNCDARSLVMKIQISHHNQLNHFQLRGRETMRDFIILIMINLLNAQ